nr:hypothetical protein [Caulobacter sp. S45]
MDDVVKLATEHRIPVFEAKHGDERPIAKRRNPGSVDGVEGLGCRVEHPCGGCFCSEKSVFRPDPLRNVISAREDSADRPEFISDRLVDEVDEAALGLAGELDRHRPSREPFARRIDVVQELEEALALKVWKNISHGAANERPWAGHRQVGLVDVLVDVVGPSEHSDKPRHLLEKQPLSFLRRSQPALRQHLVGRLSAGTEQAHHLATVVQHRRVGEGEVGLLKSAPSIDKEGDVVHLDRFTGEDPLEERAHVGLRLWPDIKERLCERVGPFAAEHLRVAVVEHQNALGSPHEEHRLARLDHDADQGL